MPHLSPLPSRRSRDIQAFQVMDLLHRARALEAAGRDIIHLEIGEPDFPTPPTICAAAQDFLAGGKVPYTSTPGLPALRETIAADYGQRFGARVDASQIILTPGASGALMLALAATTDPGDEWLMADPCYPCNRQLVRTFEGRAVMLPVSADTRFQPTAEQVARAWTPRTRGLIVASPSNPTGTLLDTDELAALHAVVAERGGVLIVDEIYQGLTYGVPASSALVQPLSDSSFVINSFSKYYGMTGWRLGWLVAPPARVRDVEKLAQHFFIAAPTVAQYAALAAFTPDTLTELERRRAAFDARRLALLPRLRALGFEIACEPQGAFYIYAGLRDVAHPLAHDSAAFAQDLMERAGVVMTPGLDFGDHHPRDHVRIAYTTDLARLHEAADRIADALQSG